jgi:hypothetical protein
MSGAVIADVGADESAYALFNLSPDKPEPEIARQKPYLRIPTTASIRFVFFLNPKNILRYITYSKFLLCLCGEIYFLIIAFGLLWPKHQIQT